MATATLSDNKYISTRNACKLCTPLGASVAFKGIDGCIPLLHGSQGCATYIRRYMISHYKEPVDIASTNFSEESAIFGGKMNLFSAIDNIISQYSPKVIGIATTCLSETIGDDIHFLLNQYKSERQNHELPEFVSVSTPSYTGTHADGFHNAVTETVKAFAVDGKTEGHINIFPGFVSPEDLRHLKEIFSAFGLKYIMAPDYSKTLDNPAWDEYHKISPGGTPVKLLKKTGTAKASVQLGTLFNSAHNLSKNFNGLAASKYLESEYSIPAFIVPLPIGINLSDKFYSILEKLSGKKTPEEHADMRGRLIDSYADGHKYVFGKKVIVYGEEDLVISLVSFLAEIGIEPILVASGGNSRSLKSHIDDILGKNHNCTISSDADFEGMREFAKQHLPDLIIGHSKGYYIARELDIPIVRLGFPVHDRFGGQRMLHLGYKGAQDLFDQIVNALLEYKQKNSPVGYKYL